MSALRTYLDWNATAPLRPEARAAMLAAFELVGNPTSPHAEGRKARAVVEDAREVIARHVNVRPRDVYFTSGATEAANWVLTPNTSRRGNKEPLAALLAGATEHACVLRGHRFPEERVEQIAVDADGRIDLPALQSRIAGLTALYGAGSTMVAVQAANNETGVLQPIGQVAELLDGWGAIVVCDAVQLAGRGRWAGVMPGADIVFLSAHKFGGPKGIGAVAFAGDYVTPEPLLKGGGQERRQRSGTENVAAIAGLAAALAAAEAEMEAMTAHALALRQRLENGLRAIRSDTVIFGEGAPRLANTSCFAVPGTAAETAVIALDLEGVAVSSGSACSSGKVGRSHVLEAMGVPAELASGAIRISTGGTTQKADIDAFLDVWKRINSRHAHRKVA
ncbi:MAG: cysteine desulfurase [Hyphomicrobiaceae bacterium]|nr:MAG: cysteine desulfurase [Hyphomicrobiaceae bacterium]